MRNINRRQFCAAVTAAHFLPPICRDVVDFDADDATWTEPIPKTERLGFALLMERTTALDALDVFEVFDDLNFDDFKACVAACEQRHPGHLDDITALDECDAPGYSRQYHDDCVATVLTGPGGLQAHLSVPDLTWDFTAGAPSRPIVGMLVFRPNGELVGIFPVY